MFHEVIHEKMSVEDWIAVPDNPIQRDTEEHAKKARNKHLKRASSSQQSVVAAMLPDGRMFKVDGHTRAYLWADGSLTPPAVIDVTIYEVSTVEDVKTLYKEYDNPYAAENSHDRLTGAYRQCDFQPKSYLLRAGPIPSAILALGTRSISLDIYKEIEDWLPVLRIIDAEDFYHKKFCAPLLAAALVTVRAHGVDALPFWRAYNNDEGNKIGKERDGVCALSDLYASTRGKRSGYAGNRAFCGRAISCFETWRSGKMYSRGAKATEIGDYLEAAKKKNCVETRRAA